jgi:hypothetical protein
MLMQSWIKRRLQEGGFPLALLVEGYLLTALVTFSPRDPGWTHIGSRDSAENDAVRPRPGSPASCSGSWVLSRIWCR